MTWNIDMTQQCLQTWIIRAVKTLRQGIKRFFASMNFDPKASSFGFLHWRNNSGKYCCSERSLNIETSPDFQIKELPAFSYPRFQCGIRVDSFKTQSSSKKSNLAIAIFGWLISASGHGLEGRWAWMKSFFHCWEYFCLSRTIGSATQGTNSIITKSNSPLKKLKNQNLQLEGKWVVKKN